MTTYGLHEIGKGEISPENVEWFDDALALFAAWEAKGYRYGWSAIALCQGERVCHILRNPFGIFPTGFLHDGVNLMSKYGVDREIEDALKAMRR